MTHNSGTDSKSETARAAYHQAKDRNGIPSCQEPEKITKLNDRNNPGKTCIQYDFTKANGDQVTIRKDNPTKYSDPSGNQGPHYNAGVTKLGDRDPDALHPADDGKYVEPKLKQHHDYERENH